MLGSPDFIVENCWAPCDFPKSTVLPYYYIVGMCMAVLPVHSDVKLLFVLTTDGCPILGPVHIPHPKYLKDKLTRGKCVKCLGIHENCVWTGVFLWGIWSPLNYPDRSFNYTFICV